MPVPVHPKIYHICHVDRLPSIVSRGGLWSDSEVIDQNLTGTTIGYHHIKDRRLNRYKLNNTHPHLYVGNCVPFYFCPRSVMLYLIDRRRDQLTYKGGQAPIIHLEADLHRVVEWADRHDVEWAYTDSNAGSSYFHDYNRLQDLENLDWDTIQSTQWSHAAERKQAEFLIARFFPWELIEKIGVCNAAMLTQVNNILVLTATIPVLEVTPDWYY